MCHEIKKVENRWSRANSSKSKPTTLFPALGGLNLRNSRTDVWREEKTDGQCETEAHQAPAPGPAPAALPPPHSTVNEVIVP